MLGASLTAAALTSLLFGLWHIPFQNPGADVAGVVRANIEFGLALALARLRLKALGPGVVIHALGNAFYLTATGREGSRIDIDRGN